MADKNMANFLSYLFCASLNINSYQIVASFYILLVGILVGSNLGMKSRRRKPSLEKKYVVQFKEGEKVKCGLVDGKGHNEEDIMLFEDVWKKGRKNCLYNIYITLSNKKQVQDKTLIIYEYKATLL